MLAVIAGIHHIACPDLGLEYRGEGNDGIEN